MKYPPCLATALTRAGTVALVVAATSLGTAGAALAQPEPDPGADAVTVVEPTPTLNPTAVPTPTSTPTPTPPAAAAQPPAARVDDPDAVRPLADDDADTILQADEDGPEIDPDDLPDEFTLTITPRAGDGDDRITVKAPRACPEDAESYAVLLVSDADLTQAAFVVRPQDLPTNADEPIEVEIGTLTELSGTFVNDKLKALAAGTYTLGLICFDGKGGIDITDSVFVAPLVLTGPDAFQVPALATPSPNPSPTPTPSTSPTPAPTPTPATLRPAASTPSNTGTTPAAASTGGTLAFTGAPIGMLAMFGGGLAALGSGLMLAGRRARRAFGGDTDV